MNLAAHIIEQNNGKVDLASMSEFDSPSFNEDLERNGTILFGADKIRKRLLANDAFIISSPEYNSSMPELMKNVIDWVSRISSATIQ